MTEDNDKEDYKTDTRSSREIAEAYHAFLLRGVETEDDINIRAIHYRWSKEEFDLGVEYCNSNDPTNRYIGAYIIGQYGFENESFHDECVDILISLLDDPDEDVVAIACDSLAFRPDTKAVPFLIKMADHPDPYIRSAVAHGLSPHTDDKNAIDTIIKLSQDNDWTIRYRTTMYLDHCYYFEYSKINEALALRLDDKVLDIRGEALLGLANRNDPRTFDYIMHEWDTSKYLSESSVEAAEILGDSRLLDRLNSFLTIDLENYQSLQKAIELAIKSCNGEDTLNKSLNRLNRR